MLRFPKFLAGDAAAARLVPPGAHSGLTVTMLSAIMAFFAVLVLALALAAGRLAEDWGGSLANSGTLQVFGGGEDVEVQARAALNVLRTTPGVQSVRMIGVEEQRNLLEPWLGSEAAVDSLPLPLLIEVVTDPMRLNIESLKLRLEGEAPDAVYDDHSGLRASLVLTAQRLRLFAFVCLGLIVMALVAVLGLAAQAAVAANTQVIRTLRIVGARDGYIVGAFTRRFLMRALAGSAVGSAVGLGLIAVLPQASEPGFFLVGIGPVGWNWAAPLLVTPVAGIIAWAATGWAVRRRLLRQA